MTKRILTVLLALWMLSSLFVTQAFAASSAKASISFSDSKITVGDTVTVTVQYSSEAAIGSYDFLLSYDATLLQYVSGADSESGNGKLPFVNYNENSDPKVVKRTVKFKAIATGSAAFSTQAKAIVNNDFSLMGVSEANASLTVNPKHTASGDNALKSLSVSGGTYSPAFSPSTTKYTMEVDYSVKKLTVSAVANHGKAKVSVSGTELDLGANKVSITVTAENGDKKTYTLTVTRKQSEFANVTTVLNGNAYVFAHDPEVLTPPEGFTPSSAPYADKSVLSFVSADGFFTLVWLTPTEAPVTTGSVAASSAPATTAPLSSAAASSVASTAAGSSAPAVDVPASTAAPVTTQPLPVAPREGWYILLSDGVTLLPYTPLSASDTQYVPLPLPAQVTLPADCQTAYPVINGESVSAYRTPYCVSNGLYLIYARTLTGNSDLYYWHEATGAFYPYLAPETVTVTVLVTQAPPASTADTHAGVTLPDKGASLWQVTDGKLTVFSLIVTALVVVLLCVLIPLAARHAKTKKELTRLLTTPRRPRITRDPAAHFGEKQEPRPSELLLAANQNPVDEDDD